MRANVRSIGLAGTTNLALLARVSEGLAPGFEPISYVERLHRLLDAMHASRRNARESELRGSIFPDPVGRFGIITHFRYALVRPPLVGASRWHLSLNVGFDGGWEPYMRVIYRDIGPLLDALLCHCDDYPGSRSADFDTYCRWVRNAEVDGGIYYTDSAATLADQRYLASVERLQREALPSVGADAAIAAYAERSEESALAHGLAQALADPATHLRLHLRALKGLYRLTSLWACPHDDILLRFAQLVLKGFSQTIAHPAVAANPAAKQVLALFADELAWLARPLVEPARAPRLSWDVSALQAALRDDQPQATHGALVLLRVTDPAKAALHLSSLAPRCAAPLAAERAVRLQVAFTMRGLRALQIHAERLDRLPAEFGEGMEPRAGMLGDLRGNHPDHWHRPLRHGADPKREDRVELGVVDVVIVMRTIDRTQPGHALHPLVAADVAALEAADNGLSVLAVEPTRSRTEEPNGRDHFGFAGEVSQPIVVADAKPDARKQQVSPGELTLGFGNDRGDGPFPAQADLLLDRGSFLVVRKLRQRLDHLDAALDRFAAGDGPGRQELLERMMGRRQDGASFVAPGPGGPNDFDFSGAGGLQCPFASHARRANPRDGRPAMPRILRRGMAYGPAADEETRAADRGTLFMAYCASIAEQFETVQRWVAGGNSSGVGSAQSDPFLGVPHEGEARVFRWVDKAGAPARADLGDKAFVELQWGLYLFVPSLAALQQLTGFGHPPTAATAPKGTAPLSDLDRARAHIEDRDNGRATWADVRARHGGEWVDPAYGRLVGSAAKVFDALADKKGAKVSVRGFGERMHASIGINHLGMDPADGHTAVGKVVNSVVAGIDENVAFETARKVAAAVLAKFAEASSGPFALRHPDGRLRVPLDLVAFSERVIGALAGLWFGLPDGVHMDVGGRLPLPATGTTPRCPGHIIGPSRMIFGAHPHERVIAEGQLHGPQVLQAVDAALTDGLKPGTGALTARLGEGLAPLGDTFGNDLLAREVAGLLLGFAPTVHGNFLTILRNWIEGDTLWSLQQAYLERLQHGDTPLAGAHAALRRPMLDTMQHEPVPPTVWRCPVTKGTPETKAPPVVLGLASAIDSLDPDRDQARRDALLFGGDYFAAEHSGRWGLHACPGSKMGTGVMLAMAATLLDAGTLRSTGSPVLLMLTPKVVA